MKRISAILLVLVLTVVGCAAQGPGQVMKADDMVGLWILDVEGSSQMFDFKEDGIYEFSMRVNRQGVPQPLRRGKYWFEEGQFGIQDTEDPRDPDGEVCAEVGLYEVQMLNPTDNDRR